MTSSVEDMLPKPSERHLESAEDFVTAEKALWAAIKAVESARVKCSGLGATPARELSITITQVETAWLWLKRAREFARLPAHDEEPPCPNDPDGVHSIGCGCDDKEAP